MSARTTRWFDAGTAALHRTLSAEGFTAEVEELNRRFPTGAYACPCCLIAYGRDALTDQPRTLTEEHVPPEQAGGVELLLTCAPCNNESGRVWDIHASRHQELHDAVLGHAGGPAPVTLIKDGLPIRGRLDPTAEVLTFDWNRKVNNPETAKDVGQRFQQAVEDNAEFEFQVGHHQPIDTAAAAWGWIRAAYLAAFAVYGYRYALLRVLTPVRQRLADPQSVDAPGLLIPTTAPSGSKRMSLVREPASLRGLLVDFGHVRVLLPAWEFPREIDDIAASLAALPTDGRAPQQAEEVSWPTEPLYQLD